MERVRYVFKWAASNSGEQRLQEEEVAKLPSTWAETLAGIAQDGLPAIILGPAGKAFSRLVAGAVEIPASWLDGKAQAIRDNTNARSTIVAAVAQASANAAIQDHALLDRALTRYVADLYSKQENRESVALAALQDLTDLPADASLTESPTEDWMDTFARHAETANSEHLRSLWGRILAGEIRKPGSFSLHTLHFLSLVDARIAGWIENALKYCCNGDFIVKQTADEKLTAEQKFGLEELGFIVLKAPFGMNNTIKPREDGNFYVFVQNMVYKLISNGHEERLVFNSCPLTTPARELANTLNIAPDLIEISKSMWSAQPAPARIECAKITGRNGDSLSLGPWEPVARSL